MHTVIGSTGNNNSRRWIWSSVILTITLLAAAKPPHVLSSDAGGWSPTGSMHTARYEATATLLPNGKVLVAGGQNSAGGAGSALASAE